MISQIPQRKLEFNPVFGAILKQIIGRDPLGLHSIFSQKRSIERGNAFKLKERAPIILAWGQGQFLVDLAKLCFESGNLTDPKGIPCQDNPLLFAHASPTLQTHKELWLNNIMKMV
jgi:hypothetical protein